jgi:hypothetical protein
MKPLCPECGDRHESYQAHVWRVANAKPAVANAVANKKRKPGKYKDPEARKEYMRELMRKRRAGG